MSIDMFKLGKNVEIEAFGEINHRKEWNLSYQIVFQEIANKRLAGLRGDSQNINRFLKAHPEEMAEVELEVKRTLEAKLIKNPEKFLYDLETSLAVVKGCQPEKMTPLADDLYNLVGMELGLSERDEDENFTDLKFYTAVNSKADYSFGVDGFITYRYYDYKTSQPKEIIVTLDVTTNTDKGAHKADLVMLFPPDIAESRKIWAQPVADYSQVIATKIKENIAAEERKKRKVV